MNFLLKFICLCSCLFNTLLLDGQEQDGKHFIYVSSIGWHTGVVVPADSFPEKLWKEGHDYSEAHYLELGWGDRDFFTHDGFHLGYAIKAALWPTRSVIHINPIYRAVEDYYTNMDVVRIQIDDSHLSDLIDYLMGSLRLENGKLIPVTEGIYSKSYFYESRERYYLLKNSNVWAARALRHAGLPINAFWHQTTGSVIRKAGEFGEKVVSEN
jgi:uncharacterized protein (TIGR02117 family)